MEDEFAWLEATDTPKVVDWARSRDREARSSVRSYSAVLFRRLVPYYRLPILRSVQLTEAGVVMLLSDDRSYTVKLLRPDGEKEEVADSRRLGKDVVIQGVQAAKDGARMALHYSEGGSDEGTVVMKDLEDGEVTDTLRGFIGNVLWTKDGYYYERTYRNEKTPDGVGPPASRIIRREHGKDEVAFGEGMPTNTFLGVAESQDGAEALLDAFSWSKSRPYCGPVDRPESWAPLYGDVDSIVVNVGAAGGRHYLLSYEKSLGHLISVGRGGKREVVKEGRWPLEGAALVGERLLCHYLVDACAELQLFGLDGRRERTLRFPVPGSLVESTTGGTISTHGGAAVVAFTSFTVPYVVYKVEGGKLRSLDKGGVVGRFDVRQRSAASEDGTRVHFFQVAKQGADPQAALLFGYGGFRLSVVPTFNPAYLPLLEDGAAFAAANLRGGLERGEEWHRDGMRENKHHVFEDYVAVLSKLKGEGLRVVGFGRSNGGLLMGATMNLRPDLFDGVLIGYPVLDMMKYHRLLMGNAWMPEYGDPDDPDDRRFLLKYSPYHNVRRRGYPPVFIYSGLKDDRVHPGHAFKFYSRLKEAGADALLRVEMESGHIGTTPRIRIMEEADKLGFVYRCLGLDPRGSQKRRRSRSRGRG